MNALTMLYVGDAAAGAKLAKLTEKSYDCIAIATEMLEALGMYITYVPNVTIVDTAAPFASEVYEHLRSIDAGPIILLTDEAAPATWTLKERTHAVHLLPRSLPAADMLVVAREVVFGRHSVRWIVSPDKRRTDIGAIPMN